MCVLDTGAVEACVWGADGLATAARADRMGRGPHLLVDHSTTEPEATRAFAARLERENGVGWVDAPLSGGPAAARAGALTVMAGGAEDDIARAAPVFADLASNV